MTKTYFFLLRFLPKSLVYILLYLWYTGLIILIISYSSIKSPEIIYFGH